MVAPSLPGCGFSPTPGGDNGGIILRYQAALFPDIVVSMLSNFWTINPNTTDIARYNANLTTPDETTYLRKLINVETLHEGYFIIQSTEPLVPGHTMTDSPLGWAMYIYQFMAELSPFYNFSLTEIITWAIMYIIQGPYPAMRFYKEFYLTQRSYDGGWDLPLTWAQRGGNVTALYVHNFGGHFAAYETPNTLLDDF
ncbi:hypothetical protein OIDMADRAFT_45369 [Oidiodendron maius Zn]|uniref:AB hydrolase-1 domain-containing protein n=1 Tax=Oidiodendron maius (strain Zn) TaxID=913774 RepID=A0A0C3C7K9_OIDMZ|nr:hypothetical protein OIDMADRAFT_45369 [Oidiodendron maius Zn]